MAGHRRREGQPPKPTRASRRDGYWQQRIGSAADAEAQLSETVAYLLALAARHPSPGPAVNAATRAVAAQAKTLRRAA